MPKTYQQYGKTLTQLQLLSTQSNPNQFLKQILRQFEHILLEELGYAIDFSVDANQSEIHPLQHYYFQINEGFSPAVKASRASLSGQQILSMLSYQNGGDFNEEQLQLLTKLYRQVITALMGDRPLKSRQLWIQNSQSQS